MGTFKVGDRAKVTGDKDNWAHYLNRGDEVEVVKADHLNGILCRTASGDERWVGHGDLEPAAVEAVDHPAHYTWAPVEVIEITEHLSFCMGNVVKYVLRADHKGNPIEDLKKARWYLDREISRRESEAS